MKRFTMLLGLAVLFLTPVVWADVPKLINFQGILRDGSGNPVPDAVYVIRFRIYDDSTAGSNLWEEFDDVQTTDGLFNVRLGDTTDLPNGLFEGSVNRFVGVKVGGDPETAPRTRLVSVPFAFHSLKSDSAVTATVALDLTCTGCVVGGLSGTILDGSITSEDLGTNSVAADEIASGAVGTSEIDATQVQRRVTGVAAPGSYVRAINQDGSITTGVDANDTYTAGTGLGLTGNQFSIAPGGVTATEIDATQVQRRVTGVAAPGSFIRAINEDGSVVTAVDQMGAASGWMDDGTVVRLSTGTDNVGIGTNTPASKLHIFNDVNADVGLRIENPNVGALAQERIDFGTGSSHIKLSGATNEMSIVNNRTSATMNFDVGGASRLFINNSGNVGIGTSSPANRLDVEGGAVVGANYSGVFTAPTNGLLVEGNVGIGSVSPSARLEVAAGQISVLGGTAAAPGYAFGADLNTGVFRPSADVIGLSINGAEQMRIAPTGNVGLGTTSPANKLDVEGGTAIGATYSGTNVAPANGLLVEGNVGIGTTSPANRLHVREDVDGAVQLTIENQNTGTNSAEEIVFKSEDGAPSNHAGIKAFDGTHPTVPAYLQIYNARPSGTILFNTNLQPRVLIANNGNVAIGSTSTPQNKLDVQGAAVIGGSFAGTNAAPANGLLVEGNVGIGTTTPTTLLHVAGQISASVGAETAPGYTFVGDLNTGIFHPAVDNLAIATGGLERLRVASSGNVGIGTGSVSARLDVEQSGLTVANFNRTTSDGTLVNFQRDGASVGSITVAAGLLTYGTFTGSHYGWTEEALECGELVSLTGVNRNSHDNPKSEIIYGIRRSTVANDPACLGSYLAVSEPSQPVSTDNPHLIMAVGNGEMWVVDEGQNIQPGDYLISSSTPGHAMKDDEEKYPIGHIVARAAEGVDWGSVGEMVVGRKHKKISVLFGNFVRSNPSTVAQTLENLQELILKQQLEIDELKNIVSKRASSEMAETER